MIKYSRYKPDGTIIFLLIGSIGMVMSSMLNNFKGTTWLLFVTGWIFIIGIFLGSFKEAMVFHWK